MRVLLLLVGITPLVINLKKYKVMSKKVTFTILSISLLTVMAGAAVAPALGTIQQHFNNSPAILVKFIVSIPALFIIVVNLFFPIIIKYIRVRTLALLGLGLYVVSGMGAFFVENIIILLVLRALLGVSVGFIMPLSTGLLAYYNPLEKMAGLMGLSAAMNQIGGIVATLLAGFLATIDWNYSFLVYALGLVAIIFVVIYLPNEKLCNSDLSSGKSNNTFIIVKKFHPCIIGMLFCMGLFFVFVSNFAITERGVFSTMQITYLMMGVDIVAFIVGILFGEMIKIIPNYIKYMPPITFVVAFIILSFSIDLKAKIVALVLIGIANGVGIPYLNTIASIKGGKDSVNSVMPLTSASLYLGQFLSPILVGLVSSFFPNDIRYAYKIAVIFSFVYFVQVFSTKKFYRLKSNDKER